MGSAVGAAVSYSQYKKQNKELKRMEEKQAKAEEEAKRLTPAEARMPDTGDEVGVSKRRGIQSTFTTSKKKTANKG